MTRKNRKERCRGKAHSEIAHGIFFGKFCAWYSFFDAGGFHLSCGLPKILYWRGILRFMETGFYIENPQIIRINYSEHYQKLKMKNCGFLCATKQGGDWSRSGQLEYTYRGIRIVKENLFRYNTGKFYRRFAACVAKQLHKMFMGKGNR